MRLAFQRKSSLVTQEQTCQPDFFLHMCDSCQKESIATKVRPGLMTLQYGRRACCHWLSVNPLGL